MKNHYKYPSIEQFRNVVRNVKYKSENYKFDLPKLKFIGTEKIHGTNAAIVIPSDGEVYFQSRERILSLESDNAGFAQWGYSNIDVFNVATDHDVKTVIVYGEWCFDNIQKNVAYNGLPKSFVVFDILATNGEDNFWWEDKDKINEFVGFCKKSGIENIYSIYDFKTWEFEIDFNQPELSIESLNAAMTEVEENSPIGAYLNNLMGRETNNTTGEGIVIKCVTEGYEGSNYWAKVKGEKHSASKVKTLAAVDVERINDIQELSAKLASVERMDQMLEKTFNLMNGGMIEMSKTKEYLKNLMDDIVKEELDTIQASGFTIKEISGNISKIAVGYMKSKF